MGPFLTAFLGVAEVCRDSPSAGPGQLLLLPDAVGLRPMYALADTLSLQ